MKRVMLSHRGKQVVMAAVTMKQKEDLTILPMGLGADKTL